MYRTILLSCCLCAPSLVGLAAVSGAPTASMSAAQIVERNIAARGGSSGWRAVKTLSWTGKMDVGGNNRQTLAMPAPKSKTPMPPPRPTEQVQVPFIMELERPRKLRLEIQFAGQTAVQVYDGTQGWKVRPFLNRHEVEQYTPQELQAAAAQAELDGPLIDYAAKGTSVALEGSDMVGGQPAYKLKLTMKDKQVQHVWIDAKTFLEVKMDGTPRRLDGRMHLVSVYLRDYKTVSGLVMPMLYETAVEGVSATEKINIDAVVVNPKLPDSHFAKPG
ncbi:MAG: outer membrane lipoprotein-sorting protein [Pseudomonadota bacterium]|nr:outer membrane lipoprotein-sorting protein [Pseudomonadota bacterium]